MTTSRQYLQAVRRLGLLFNKESQLTDITGAKDIDKAENCYDKFAILCHEVTRFSQEMGMEMNLRDLLDDYGLVEKIIKEVKAGNPNLLPKIQLEKGHNINEKTAMELLDAIMYPEVLELADNRLKYNTIHDIAQALRTGNGNDDECLDYEYRGLQRAVIMVLITIGVIPLNKNSEPKNIEADNEYAYKFFEKYILGKLPESNMNIGSFAALDAWKNITYREMDSEYNEDDILYCKNRINIICLAIYVTNWYYITIANPEKSISWMEQHLDKTIPDDLVLTNPGTPNVIFNIVKLDDWRHQILRMEIEEAANYSNPHAQKSIREIDEDIQNLKSINLIIKDLRNLKKIKDSILILPKIENLQSRIGKIVYEVKNYLMEITDKVKKDPSKTYEIIDNEKERLSEICGGIPELICEKEKESKHLENISSIKPMKTNRFVIQFFKGNYKEKFCTIYKPNDNLTMENYIPENSVFQYSISKEGLKLVFERNSDASDNFPDWLGMYSENGIDIDLRADNEINVDYLIEHLGLDEANKLEWAHKFYCDKVALVTRKYLYCEIEDSEQYYRIKRNNSISKSFNKLLPEDTILIFRMKENPDKLLLSVNKLGIEMKDISGNPDFEIVDNIEL